MNKKSKWSINLGRIAGIEVRIHWTFFILFLYVLIVGRSQGQNLSDSLMMLAFILAVFFCVTLHEFGHALMAKKFGCKTRDITLLPIGGLARMNRLPENPSQEMLVALAGPFVNLVIAVILYVWLSLNDGLTELIDFAKLDAENFFPALFVANVVLAVFNLIPAFPMDGGRVLRALLSMRLPRHKATRIAGGVGQFIAILFVFIGLFYNPFLVFIGVFIFLGAQIETDYYQSKYLLRTFRIGDAMIHQFKPLHPSEPLSAAVNALLDGHASEFVVQDNSEPAGILTRKIILEALKTHGLDVPISQVMEKNFSVAEEEGLLDKAYEKMRMNNISIMPVVKGKKLVGLIDMENIMEFLLVRAAIANNKKLS
ncbi:MAG: site-2 protease family protein [Bacteroidetes bacterium]|nr:MAG: site-2 protease family protein [Bacteroidota bacterium]REK05237.1 MAG: site-2 protease family protein [Bacteroidota bacterium]REK32642.1 MAG: site-2 protease family protein [Bacteroidota bacterium]REK48911.1 MAG: site-2 protease family protein [Bacteroidota bacterium]